MKEQILISKQKKEGKWGVHEVSFIHIIFHQVLLLLACFLSTIHFFALFFFLFLLLLCLFFIPQLELWESPYRWDVSVSDCSATVPIVSFQL